MINRSFIFSGVLKPFGFSKSEHHAMLCHDWLTPRHVTIGTKAGKILLLEDAELKQTVDVGQMVQQFENSKSDGKT